MCYLIILCDHAKIKKYVLFKKFFKNVLQFGWNGGTIQSNETNTH